MSFRPKVFLVLATVLVTCSLLVGFAASAADNAVTLRVLNYFDATSPNADRELNEVWGAFDKANPNIKIEREDLFNEPFHQKVQAYIAAGTIPDVMFMWPSGRSADLFLKKLVKDLRPFLGANAQEFSDAALAPQLTGILGELPSTVTVTNMLYTNNKLLKSMGLHFPKTYTLLVQQVKTLKAKGLDTILMGYQDDWVGQSCLFSMICGRMIGDEFIDDCLAGKAKFTDAEFVKALAFYAKMYKDGVLSVKNLSISYGDVNGLWAVGKAPYLIDGDWKVSNFLTDPNTKQALIPVSEQASFGLNNFPAIPGEINPKSNSSVTGVGFGMSSAIPAGSDKEKAAWKLISWLQSATVQKLRLETGGTIPSRKGVSSDKLEPLVKTRIAFYGTLGKGTYVLDGALNPKVYQPINIGLQQIGLGKDTPKGVAAKVQAGYEVWKSGK